MTPSPMMMEVLSAATASPSSEPAAATAFEWWSDIVLPALVGLGSVGAAVVATFIAARSNRLARAATAAAERSNAIAKRAIALELQRDEQAAAAAARAERRSFAERWGAISMEVGDDIGTERRVSGLSSAWIQLAHLSFESAQVGYASFPVVEAMEMLKRAGALRDPVLMTAVLGLTNSLMTAWVETPDDMEEPLAMISRSVDNAIQQREDEMTARGGEKDPGE